MVNKRIDRLFEHALDEAVPETWTTLDFEQLSKLKAKFAELIVKECMDVAHRHTPETEECEYSWLIHDKIKQHFGVEE